MRALVLTLIVVAGAAGSGAAQKPKSSLAARLKGAVKGAADSAATRAAAAVVDSALGTGDSQLGAGDCPPGLMAQGATVGTAAVGKVKELIGSDSAAVRPRCVADTTAAGQHALAAAAAMQAQQAAQAQAMAAQAMAAQAAAQSATPGASTAMAAVAAATPVGLAVGAAPVAAKGVKAIGGLFGKGQTRESMIEDLSEGRLELKAVRFIGGSDAMKDEVDDAFAALAEALKALEGDFVLNLPPESDGKTAPDTAMARRRLEKLSAHLALAGIGDRLELRSEPPGLEAGRKLPKRGEARVEILRKPEPDAGTPR